MEKREIKTIDIKCDAKNFSFNINVSLKIKTQNTSKYDARSFRKSPLPKTAFKGGNNLVKSKF